MYSKQRTIKKLRLFFQTLFYLAPIVVALAWAFASVMHGIGFLQYPVPDKLVTFTSLTTFLAILVSLLPCGIVMYGLNQLIHLFKNYEKNKIFTQDNIVYYRKLGFTLFAWVLSGLIYDALLSFILTMNNIGYHKKMVAIQISGIDLTTLIVGAIVLIIAWVMAEGYKISEEHAHTV